MYWDFSRLVWCGVASCWPKNLPMFCSLCMAASRWRRFSLSWVANRAAIPTSMSWTFQTTSHWYVPVHILLWLDKHLFTLKNEVNVCKSQFTVIMWWIWMLTLEKTSNRGPGLWPSATGWEIVMGFVCFIGISALGPQRWASVRYRWERSDWPELPSI